MYAIGNCVYTLIAGTTVAASPAVQTITTVPPLNAEKVLTDLKVRDTKVTDLVQMGREWERIYGEPDTTNVLNIAWIQESHGASRSQATNVIWLSKQGARCQDLAWLIAYEREWIMPVNWENDPDPPTNAPVIKESRSNIVRFQTNNAAAPVVVPDGTNTFDMQQCREIAWKHFLAGVKYSQMARAGYPDDTAKQNEQRAAEMLFKLGVPQ